MGKGLLVLKGGETLPIGVQKKKKKKAKKDTDEEQQLKQEQAQEAVEGEQPGSSKPKPVDPTAVNVMSGKKYEQEFEYESQRAAVGRQRNTPWGSTYRKAPEILHGYTRKVTGATAEERLDMRAAQKADRMCK